MSRVKTVCNLYYRREFFLSLTYSSNHCLFIFNMMMLLMIHFKIFWIIYLFGIACSYTFNWLLLLNPPPSLSLKCIWLYASSQQFTCFIYTIFSTTISIFTFSKAEQKNKNKKYLHKILSVEVAWQSKVLINV